jgi:hypothetical protein
MNSTVVIFVNLSQEDARVWAVAPDDSTQFVATLASGASVRHLSAPGQKWSVVTSDSFPIPAGDKNRVYIIGSSGVYEVESVRGVAADSGTVPPNMIEFPVGGGSGGWP